MGGSPSLGKTRPTADIDFCMQNHAALHELWINVQYGSYPSTLIRHLYICGMELQIHPLPVDNFFRTSDYSIHSIFNNFSNPCFFTLQILGGIKSH